MERRKEMDVGGRRRIPCSLKMDGEQQTVTVMDGGRQQLINKLMGARTAQDGDTYGSSAHFYTLSALQVE
jgi:hypothetical protein